MTRHAPTAEVFIRSRLLTYLYETLGRPTKRGKARCTWQHAHRNCRSCVGRCHVPHINLKFMRLTLQMILVYQPAVSNNDILFSVTPFGFRCAARRHQGGLPCPQHSCLQATRRLRASSVHPRGQNDLKLEQSAHKKQISFLAIDTALQYLQQYALDRVLPNKYVTDS